MHAWFYHESLCNSSLLRSHIERDRAVAEPRSRVFQQRVLDKLRHMDVWWVVAVADMANHRALSSIWPTECIVDSGIVVSFWISSKINWSNIHGGNYIFWFSVWAQKAIDPRGRQRFSVPVSRVLGPKTEHECSFSVVDVLYAFSPGESARIKKNPFSLFLFLFFAGRLQWRTPSILIILHIFIFAQSSFSRSSSHAHHCAVGHIMHQYASSSITLSPT